MGILQPDVGHGGRHREIGLSGTPKAVTIHNLRQARAAIAAAAETDSAVCLISAPNAAAYTGPGWFAAVIDEAQRDHPTVPVTAVLDCGVFAGYALAALRHGLTEIVFDGPAIAAIQAIAAEHGAKVMRGRPESLDLDDVADDEAQALCQRWLSGDAESG